MKIKTLSLKDSIMWMGHSTKQINSGGGTTLELMEKLRLVIATPNDPKRPTKLIPVENIIELEELTAELQAKAAAEALALTKAREESAARIAAKKAAEEAAGPALTGTTKFVKDPVTGAIVATQV